MGYSRRLHVLNTAFVSFLLLLSVALFPYFLNMYGYYLTPSLIAVVVAVAYAVYIIKSYRLPSLESGFLLSSLVVNLVAVLGVAWTCFNWMLLIRRFHTFDTFIMPLSIVFAFLLVDLPLAVSFVLFLIGYLRLRGP